MCNIVYASISIDGSVYTSVLSDLRRSADFVESDYTVDEDDFSLSVITIAESSDSDLFLYVYQPSMNSDTIATHINMSVALSHDLLNDENKLWMSYREESAMNDIYYDTPLIVYLFLGLKSILKL